MVSSGCGHKVGSVGNDKSSRERGGSEVAESAETQNYSRERGGSEVAESVEARRSQRSRRLKSSRERGG